MQESGWVRGVQTLVRACSAGGRLSGDATLLVQFGDEVSQLGLLIVRQLLVVKRQEGEARLRLQVLHATWFQHRAARALCESEELNPQGRKTRVGASV